MEKDSKHSTKNENLINVNEDKEDNIEEKFKIKKEISLKKLAKQSIENDLTYISPKFSKKTISKQRITRTKVSFANVDEDIKSDFNLLEGALRSPKIIRSIKDREKTPISKKNLDEDDEQKEEEKDEKEEIDEVNEIKEQALKGKKSYNMISSIKSVQSGSKIMDKTINENLIKFSDSLGSEYSRNFNILDEEPKPLKSCLKSSFKIPLKDKLNLNNEKSNEETSNNTKLNTCKY